ncbi:MAG: DUF1501 domain-containing protein [Planctomycetota bacterium]|nr:MAG: DUF1501 domain-containing protein [Planctomycetota bacterium]REK27374.1 MAG: DUF1501 domain-containing protein [Planctomycetota bacterium]REK36604.1 MAG: DUF1501 domain-containing protein [Planctomycetota bacterium]
MGTIMFSVLGSPRRCCDGLTRRETLHAGALSALGGFGLPQLLSANEAGQQAEGPAKNVILLFLLGGAATQDMFDLKPEAPDGVRSEFKPISTTVPGLQVCEHLPQMAQTMQTAAVVRSVTHQAGCHNTLPTYTGYEIPLTDNTTTKESYPPSMGSVCEYLRLKEGRGNGGLPDYVYMPCYLGWGQGIRRPGPYGGFLGHKYDALTTECDPFKAPDAPAPAPGTPQVVHGSPRIPSSQPLEGLSIDRLNARRTLQAQFDDRIRRLEQTQAVEGLNRNYQLAYNLLTSSALKEGFDVESEPDELRDRYGRTLFGECSLIGRRLVERGVRFVNVTWDLFWGPVNIDYDAWDTHRNNFSILRDNKLPGLDQTYSALINDLQDRGLLDETLVVVMSEMGRTPRVNGNAGRDHWTQCYGALFAGAGIRGGTVYGASDSQAAYVTDNPVSTSDICATIYHCLGIDYETRVPDPTGRPTPIDHGGRPIEGILA